MVIYREVPENGIVVYREVPKESTETNKLVEQSCRIKGQCAKGKLFFIYTNKEIII